MIHGDLKGVRFLCGGCSTISPCFPVKANILIDQTGHARLADFGLLTVISDPANLLSSTSYVQGGTARWMSPELIAPQEFGLRASRPTRSSDCYSLAMVVYETISGSPPFHEDKDLAVFVKVLKGERPTRGIEFTNRLWKVLEQCWMARPDDRPSIEDVLQCLETCSSSSETASGGIGDEPGSDGGKSVLDKRGDCSPHNRNSPSDDRPPELGSGELEITMGLVYRTQEKTTATLPSFSDYTEERKINRLPLVCGFD